MLYLDSVVNAAEEALAIPDPVARQTALKGSLFYWLGVSYDEGSVHAKDMETAMHAQNEMVVRLKSKVNKLEAQLTEDTKTRTIDYDFD